MKPFEVEEAGALCDKIIDGVREVFVGNRVLLRMLLAACMANGHVLF
jgi:MoxR-like ATPase